MILITTNFSLPEGLARSKDRTNPFFEQVKAVQSALEIFDERKIAEIRSAMGSGKQPVRGYVYEDGNSYEIIANEVANRLLISLRDKQTHDTISLCHFGDSGFYPVDFRFRTQEEGAEATKNEDVKWAFATQAIALIAKFTLAEKLNLESCYRCKVLEYSF